MSKKKPTSPTPVNKDEDDTPEVDMGVINKLLNKEINDDDIQLTDADMDDPELLAMLSQIESGGSTPKPQPVQQPIKPQPVPQQPIKPQQPIQQTTNHDEDDELNKLMNDSDNDVNLDDLDDDEEVDNNPSPTKKPKPNTTTTKPSAQNQPQQSKNQQVESVIIDLEERKSIYSKNALLYSNNGLQQEAMKFIRSSRVIDSSIEKLKKGESVDLKDVPPRIQLVTLDQIKSGSSTPTTTTPIKSTPTPTSTSTSTTTSNTSTPKSTNSVSPQSKNLEILSRERIEDEERQQVWELIEHDYMKKYHFLTSEAIRLKDVDKIEAITLLKQSKSIRAILDQIEFNKSHRIDPPPFRFEEKSTTKEITFLHLKDNEVELIISKPEMDKVFGNTDVYITGEFPYPDTLQKFQTPTFNCSKSDTFTFTTKFSSERKKSYERVLEKKKLSLVFYSQRMIFMKSIVGKIDIKLTNLLTKCEINERLPILKEGSKRETGAFINISIRVRTPLLKREVKTAVEKVLVLDTPIQISHEIATLNSSSKNSTPAVSNTTTTTTTSSTITQPISKPQPQPQQQPISKPTPQPQQQPISKPTPQQQQPVSKPQPQQQPISKPTPQPQPTVSKPQPTVEENDGDDEDDDYDNVERLVSNDVLESALDQIKLQIQKQGSKPELLEQKQSIEMKLQVLEVQVQSGILSIEAYVKQIENAIESDKKLALKLSSKGDKEKAVKVMARIKIMKAELESAG